MAITFIGSAVASGNPTTSCSVVIPTVQVGDILILATTNGGATAAPTVSDGSGIAWTQKSSAAVKGRLFWKRVTNAGTESGATITASGFTNSSSAVLHVIRGGKSSGDPFHQFTSEENAAANETHAGFTTTVAGCWIGLAVCNGATNGDVAVTAMSTTSPGSLQTNFAEKLSTGGVDCACAMGGAVQASAGATGNFTWAQTDLATTSQAFAIEPEPVAAVPPPLPVTNQALPSNLLSLAMLVATGPVLALVPPPPSPPAYAAITQPVHLTRNLYVKALQGPPITELVVPPNTETIDKWQQPLSRAADKPPVHQGWTCIPLDTRQAAQTPAPLGESTSAQLLTRTVYYKALQGPPVQAVAAAPDNNQDISKWQQPLSKAAPRPPVNVGTSLTPFDTRQENTQDISKWLQGLSKAAPRPPVRLGISLVPFDTRQPNTQDISKWQQPLSRAAPRPPSWPGLTFVPFDTRQINTEDISKWQQPLSTAARIPYLAAQGITFAPFDTAQIIFNTITIDKWQQPLSKAVPIPRYAVGISFVPFDTAQIVADIRGWFGQTNTAAPSGRPPRLTPPSYEFRPTAFTQNTVDIGRWQQPLGHAAKRPPVWTGVSFTPFDTAQIIFNTVTIDKWQQPLGRAVIRLPLWVGVSFTPLDTTQAIFNTVTIDKWQQPLSQAARIPRYQPGTTFVPFDTEQVFQRVLFTVRIDAAFKRTLYIQSKVHPLPPIEQPPNTETIDKWQQPLSRAAQIPRYQVGFTFVPLNTVQFIAPEPEPEPEPPTPEYDYPIGRSLKSDYGIRGSRRGRNRYVIGRR